jgi:acyl-CoA thioesterase I
MIYPMSHLLTRPLAVLSAIALTLVPVFAQNNTPVDLSHRKVPVKLACIGDSITHGYGTTRSWPQQIGDMLGGGWSVHNFGVNSATLMNRGDLPYQKLEACASALHLVPDVVVILLGTNDTKPNNWQYFASDYEKDYRDLVEKFARLETKPRIFLCKPPYIAKEGNWGINEKDTKAQIPVIEKLAKAMNVGVIDVHGALNGRDALIPDNVHPNTEGATLIAQVVFQALVGKAVPAVLNP